MATILFWSPRHQQKTKQLEVEVQLVVDELQVQTAAVLLRLDEELVVLQNVNIPLMNHLY